MLLLHGTEDCVSPRGQSKHLREALDAAGACAVQRTVLGAGHGGPAWTSPEVQEVTADFLDRVLE
jgi:predicted esterase